MGNEQSSVIELKVSNGVLRIEAVADHTFRVRRSSTGQFKPAVLHRYGILEQPALPISVQRVDDAQSVGFNTAQARLLVNKSDGRLTLYDSRGKVVLREAAPSWSDADQGFGAEYDLSADERIYGLGDISRECLNRRGTSALIWVKDVTSYVPIPYIMSDRGWALMTNTTWKHQIDIGKTEPSLLRFGGNEGELDYYLFVGDTPAILLDRYTDVAGKPALLPLSAYGLTFVCNQEATARDMLDDCLNLRRAGIPCDLVGLEPGWMAKYQPEEQKINTYDFSLEKTWHPARFYIPAWLPKGPGTFIDAARRMGFKLSLWMCSDYDLSYEEERQATGHAAVETRPDKSAKPRFHDDAVENDALLQGTVFMDQVTKPNEPWFDHLKKFVDQGAMAFKLDGAMQVLEHPDRRWGNGMTDQEMHNLYPLIYGKQMSQGYSQHTGQRAMIYSAGGYTGIQQYVATWAGDTGGGAKPLVSLINHGLSGHVNTSCDMEVFTPAGIHFGFFQPWSQVCSWAYWRHPWMLGDELLPVFQYYSQLRYRLLPYIYSMAHVAYRTGLPIVRGMPLVYPDDPKSESLVGQYLFGDAFLVAAFTDDVHLPAGRWIDYWTGETHEGPKDISYTAPKGRGGALFIRAGAIVPEWPLMDYVGQKPVDEITLHIYPHGRSAFTLYEDDGITHGYQDGAVAQTAITCQITDGQVEVTIAPRAGAYPGMPTDRRFDLRIRADAKPRDVRIAAVGDPAWRYDESDKIIYIQLAEDPARQQPVRMTCTW